MRVLPVLRGLLLVAVTASPAWSAGLEDRAADVAAHARCVARSVDIGKPMDPTKAGACWKKSADALDAALSAKKKSTTKLAAALRFAGTCSKALDFGKLPPDDGPAPDEGAEFTPKPEYFEKFVKLMPARGKAVAQCWADLQDARRSSGNLNGGNVVVELAVARSGRAREVVLLETTGVSGIAVTCVVDALCALEAKPTKRAFYVELPFSFTKPRSGAGLTRGLRR